MSTPLLATTLYLPPPWPGSVIRRRLLERLNEGLHCKLTLVSAPAGFGETTLVGEWLADCGQPVAWLSLDETDNDLVRFMAYLETALQPISGGLTATARMGEAIFGEFPTRKASMIFPRTKTYSIR